MTSVAPNSQQARDISYLFHPYTDARRFEREGPLVIARGQGIYVFDDEGRRYIEGLAGLWSVAVGFAEKRLVRAAARQMETLPFYHLFGGKSHDPSILLAEKLVSMTPQGLGKVFFTNSGSEANDTAMKLVWFYNNACGRHEKKKIISRTRAYHGVTIASGSLTGLPANHRGMDLPIAGVIHASCPHHWRFGRDGESEEAFSARLAAELDEIILREGPDTVGAFFGEPIMGAGGVITPPAGYWQAIQAVCRKHDVLLVVDEVISGFGRTGRMFASELYAIDPDILVVSKQLTSSYQPLAAIVFKDALYQPIADYTAQLTTFGHGFTASGHPVATAVALENLKIIEERDLVARAAELAPRLQEGLRRHRDHPLVGEVRGIGLIAGLELVSDKAAKSPFATLGKVGGYLAARCLKHGLIIRNIGDTIAFCPPLIIEAAQIDDMLDAFARGLDDTWQWYQREH
jgi:4-aminobutyrate--pyruvate transaminase